MLKRILFSLSALIVLLFTACEPISVSVSPKGEIAFTRSEGIFFLDAKSGDVSPIFWNGAQGKFPAVVAWSADGTQLAYTLKKSKDAMATEIFVAPKGGKGVKLKAVDGVVTKLVWSPDGTYLAYATGGADSDMSVADIHVVTVSSKMSKVLVSNAADLFYWLDDKTVATVKLDSKVAEFDGRFLGKVIKASVDGSVTPLTETFVTEKKGAMDGNKKGEILFSSLSFDLSRKADSAATSALYKTGSAKKSTKMLDKAVTVIKYNPDGSKALLMTKETKTVDYSEKTFYHLSLFNPANKSETVLRRNVQNAISVETNTLDLIPSWLDGKNVLFFNMMSNYGSSVQNLSLFKLDVTSKKMENLQPKIDSEINKIVMSKGGY